MNTLTLGWLRSLRFPMRDKAGKLLWEKRFQWAWHGGADQVKQKHWQLDFTINGWDWYIDLAPEKGEWDNGRNDDPTWEKSGFIFMWLGNRDPHRFLVAIDLHEPQDLIRFLQAFKLEFYQEGREP